MMFRINFKHILFGIFCAFTACNAPSGILTIEVIGLHWPLGEMNATCIIIIEDVNGTNEIVRAVIPGSCAKHICCCACNDASRAPSNECLFVYQALLVEGNSYKISHQVYVGDICIHDEYNTFRGFKDGELIRAYIKYLDEEDYEADGRCESKGYYWPDDDDICQFPDCTELIK